MSIVYSSISYGVSGLEVAKVLDAKMEFTVPYTSQINAIFTEIPVKISGNGRS